MRILVITNMYPPHHYGGYELSCQDTVRRWSAAGHDVSVLTSDIDVPGAGPDDNREPVRRDLRMYWDDFVLLSPSVPARVGVERANQAALRRAIEQARPDIVSVWNMGAFSLGLLTTLHGRRLPVVFVLGDDWPVYGQDLDAWSRIWRGRRASAAIVRAVTRLPTAAWDYSTMGPCLFNSGSMRQVVAEHSGWTLPRNAIVHPGVDVRDFPVAPSDEPSGDGEWQGRLLYVGRIDERKGVDTAIRALPHIPRASLEIKGRGDGQHLLTLHALVSELGLEERVRFSVVERRDLRKDYAAADALLFTSVYREPFGIVPLEAMACDTPVVATGVGGSGEYLDDGGNCLLYPPGDPAGLAAAVTRLASDPGLRRRLVAAGRDTARRLTSDAYAEELLRWHVAEAGGESPPG